MVASETRTMKSKTIPDENHKIMKPELITLVEQYLKGDTMPLFSERARAVMEEDGSEAIIAHQSAAAIAERLRTGLSPMVSVQSFDGHSVGIGCGRHPPQFFTVSTQRSKLPLEKNRTIHIFNLPSRLPAQIVCKECVEEQRRNSLIKYGERVEVCAKHKNIILSPKGLCEKCEENQTSQALNGEPVAYLKAEGRYSFYVCPLHGEFKVGHRAQGKCPVCDSIDGISQYATTLDSSDHTNLIRLKELLVARHPVVSKQLSQTKRLAIMELNRHLIDHANNSHLLHIFPTSAFLSGEWAADIEELAGMPLHFMPTAQQRIMQEVVAITDAQAILTDPGHKELHNEIRANYAEDSRQ